MGRWMTMSLGMGGLLFTMGCVGFTVDSVFPVANDSIPTIELIEPEDGQLYLSGEPIEIQIQVDDGEDDPVDVSVLVLSDLEGELCRITPGTTGLAVCSAQLEEGTHLLLVTAWDPIHSAERDLAVEIFVIDK